MPTLYRVEKIKIKTSLVLDRSEKNEKNFPAKEKTRKEGARLQKKNVNKKRKKSACPQKSKGQKKALLLICFKQKETGMGTL